MATSPSKTGVTRQEQMFGNRPPRSPSGSVRSPKDGFSEHLRIHKTIRLAVSGDVHITRLEKEIIDTRDFQRLRGIRQLGSVYLVYPTALHTRFDHSLGALEMVERMMTAIESNTHGEQIEKEITAPHKILARLYALLHDITHISFGHTLEDELNILQRHDENSTRIERFLGSDSDIGKIIKEHVGASLHARLLAIYKWKGEDDDSGKSIFENDDAFIYDLVSNTICADLLDYIQRDNYFCNLAVDIEYRFLNFIYLGKEKPSDKHRRVLIRLWKDSKKRRKQPRRDTLTDLVRLLETRYLIAERVYFHHTKIVTGMMIGRAVKEMLEAEKIEEKDFFAISDDNLIERMASQEDVPVARNLAANILERNLHVILHVYTEPDFIGQQEQDHGNNAIKRAIDRFANSTARKKFEDDFCEELEIPPGSILIYVPSHHMPDKAMNPKVAKMKVLWKGEVSKLCDIDDQAVKPRLQEIINSHRMLWGLSVAIAREFENSDSLDNDICHLIRLKMDAEIEADETECAQKKLDYTRRLVERAAKKVGHKLSPQDFLAARDSSARELLDAASSDLTWRQRLDQTVKKNFVEARTQP